MYFNQLAKAIGIGQQSILRHMQALEEGGFIKTYEEKSNLGGPNRKYYRLSSSFSLIISMSQDSFSVTNNQIIEKLNFNSDSNINKKYLAKLFTNSKSLPKDSVKNELISVQKNLLSIENGISDLESRLNNLQTLKQSVLHRLHEIGKDNFGHLERKILYKAITAQTSMSISKLASVLNENESHVKNAVCNLEKKLDKDTITMLFS
jgi:predicted transcriptional regulator